MNYLLRVPLQMYSTFKGSFLCVLLIFFVVSSVAYSFKNETYTISGSIKDKETGESVIGASVQIVSLKKGSVSNKYGFYSIAIPSGKYVLLVKRIGYQQYEDSITVNEVLSLNIELSPQVRTTEDVIVTAEKRDENVLSTEVGTIKLQMSDIKKLPVILGETDVLKAIQLLPGVTVASEASGGFNVRGGGADQNLVLLDEATLYNASHILGFFSVFNPDAIKDFTLYKAGIPANYGGRLSSVLDVRQKDGNNKEFGVTGGIGLLSSKLLIEGPIVKDKGSFMLAGRRTYADLFLAFAPDEAIRDNIAYFYDFNAKASYEIGENDRVFLSGYFGRDRFEVASTIGNIYGNTTLNLRWNHIYNADLFSNISMIYNNYDYEFQILAPGTSFGIQSNIISYNAKADFFYRASQDHKLEFGGEGLYYNFVPGNVRPLKESNITPRSLDNKFAYESSLYLRDEWEISPLLSVDAGLRYNMFWRIGNEPIRKYENNEPVRFNQNTGQYEEGVVTSTTQYANGDVIANYAGFEPRVSARYLLTDETSLKASYNRTRQNLALISNTASPTPLDLWQPAGPYIKPQTADQYSLGYFSKLFDNEYKFSIEGYYKNFNDIVDFVDGANLFGNNFIETEILTGVGRAYGIELFLEKVVGDLTGWISYSYSQSQRKIDEFNGGPGVNNGQWYSSPFNRPNVLNVVGTYKLSQTWTLSANFVYYSGIPATFPSGRYDFNGLIIPQYNGTRNAQKLPDYHRFDVSARWESLVTDGFRSSWVFGVYNAYNRMNATSIVFRQNQDSYQSESVRLALFGIVPSIGWEFQF